MNPSNRNSKANMITSTEKIATKILLFFLMPNKPIKVIIITIV
jgi:hypothetical protein